ncbi:hypothetical protein C7446_1716 [Kushneria sinocarnis]|uniref:Uncharacterized protein n=1 Tax=Kushneria sinocarnis TaxID=595502 RepID=A0A420WXU1_9GAMM|nr:hypothetical protein C7446_1716 [Kushneria sinocarnis]
MSWLINLTGVLLIAVIVCWFRLLRLPGRRARGH